MSAEHRDTRGRFLPGCPAGPGSGLGRRAAHAARVLREAITDQDLQAAIRKVAEMAAAGDMAAARLLFERVAGKAPDPIEEGADGAPGVPIALGDLGTASSCADAMRKVVHGLTAGAVDAPTAASLLAMVEMVSRAHERTAMELIEQRLAALEADQDRSMLQ